MILGYAYIFEKKKSSLSDRIMKQQCVGLMVLKEKRKSSCMVTFR